MKKICVVCGQGLGSSLIIEINVKSAIKELNLKESDYDVTHLNLNSYSEINDFDIVVCGFDLSDSINPGKAKKLVLQNLMDKEEIKSKLLEIL